MMIPAGMPFWNIRYACQISKVLEHFSKDFRGIFKHYILRHFA